MRMRKEKEETAKTASSFSVRSTFTKRRIMKAKD